VAQQGSLFHLELWLKSGGPVLECELVRYFEEGQGLLVRHAGKPLWLNLSDVAALSWSNWTESKPRTSRSTTPTRLELKRRLQSLEGEMGLTIKCALESLPDNEQSLSHLNEALLDLQSLWTRLKSDELGQQALSSIHFLKLDWGSSGRLVERREHHLLLTLSLGSEGLLKMDAAQVAQQLEAVL